MPSRDSRARHLAIATARALLFVLLAGVTYQSVSTALERREFPYPGKLVDAGGHQLHIWCTGSGTPTVVLEAPAAAMSAAWGWVQPEIAKVTRVCSYDRAGLGWSESAGPYDPARVPIELHTVLQNAGERSPFVLVGQGLGAEYIRLYAGAFPATTAALVLIDTPRAQRDSGDTLRPQLVRLSPWLARVGLLRMSGVMSKPVTGLPDSARGPALAFLNRPDHLSRAARELARWDDVVALAETAPRGIHAAVDLSAAGGSSTAMSSDQAAATRVARAVTDVVVRLRSTSAPAPSATPPVER